jgi:hypothetical protein
LHGCFLVYFTAMKPVLPKPDTKPVDHCTVQANITSQHVIFCHYGFYPIRFQVNHCQDNLVPSESARRTNRRLTTLVMQSGGFFIFGTNSNRK